MEKLSKMQTLRKFFETDTARPVQTTEFITFWKACTDDEKLEYARQAATLMGTGLAE